MTKTADMRIQLEPDLKKEVENIFRTLGLTTTEAITLFFRSVIKKRDLPFDIDDIPNEEILKVMKDTDEGKNLVEYADFDDFVKKLEA